MVEKIETRSRNVIDLWAYRQLAAVAAQMKMTAMRRCSHCGAALGDDESEDECSTLDASPRFRAVVVPLKERTRL
jgi:hypothetical protein